MQCTVNFDGVLVTVFMYRGERVNKKIAKSINIIKIADRNKIQKRLRKLFKTKFFLGATLSLRTRVTSVNVGGAKLPKPTTIEAGGAGMRPRGVSIEFTG